MHQVKRKLLQKGLKRFSKTRLRYLIDFLFFSIGFAVSSAIALVISIMVNENLTDTELGRYSYNKSALELMAMVFTLTIHRSYLRFNTKGKSLVVSALVKKYIKIAFVLLGLAAYYLTESPFAILFALFVFFEERQYFLRSLMDVLKLNLLKVGAAFITLATIFVFIKNQVFDDQTALFAYGLGFSIALLFGSKKYKVNDDSQSVTHKMVLMFCIPALGAVLVKLLLDFSGQYFLKLYFDYSEVAKYAICLRVILAVKLISTLLMMFYPMVYFREVEMKNWKAIMKLRAVIIGVMLLASSLVLLFPNFIFKLMGASQYLAYTNIFQVLILSEVIFLIGTMFGTYLSFALKTHLSLLIMTVGLIVNVLILWVFVPSNGALVASYAVLAANILIMLAHLFISFRMEIKYVRGNG